MYIEVNIGGNVVSLEVETQQMNDGRVVLTATIPGDCSHTSHQYFRGESTAIRQAVLESAAGCLYPQYVSHDLWDHGCMG